MSEQPSYDPWTDLRMITASPTLEETEGFRRDILSRLFDRFLLPPVPDPRVLIQPVRDEVPQVDDEGKPL